MKKPVQAIANRYFPLTAVLFILSAIFVIYINQPNKVTVSNYILDLTTPITSIEGRISKIEKNGFYLTRKKTISNTDKNGQTYQEISELKYKVLVDQDTKISKSQPFIPYLFKPNAIDSVINIGLEELGVGEVVTVTSRVDLRTLPKNTFVAKEINLNNSVNSITGKITNIEGNTVYVSAQSPGPQVITDEPVETITPSEIVTYSVKITPETEISYMKLDGEENQPELLSVSDLSKDMQIVIFTNNNIRSNLQFDALRIDPKIITATPTPQVQQ
jgi:hypothetical protein